MLANDTDVDAGPKSIQSVTQPAHGTVAITGGGTGLTYAPNANYCNTPTPPTDDFTYTLNGGDAGAVKVTVTCVDDAPTAVDDTPTVAEDAAAAAVAVLTNDTDIDAGPKSIQSVTQPTNGAVVITGGGTGLTYQPNAGYCNDGSPTDNFNYALAPGGSTATVHVTVSCVDDPPTAVDDSGTVAEDAAAAPVPVLTNDTDTDGGPKTINSVTQPANGTVAIIGGGAGLTYAPDADYCNAPPGTTLDTFTYTLNGGSTGTVSMTVTCADDAPVAVNDSKTVGEDDPATAVNVLSNDNDIDGGPISIGSVTQPANGSVVITGGGTGLTYAPDADYCNAPPGTTPDTFTYTLTPGSSTATVSVSVTCADDAPVAVNDSATVAEDSGASAVTVLANDTDIDGGPKSVASVTQPANGTVVITGGGTGLTYAPDANYCNTPPGTTPDTFTYTLSPGGSSATVSVTVTCVDDPPVAVDDADSVLVNASAAAVNVLANDTDIDGGPKSIASVTQPANGTVVITGGGAGLTYQPNATYCNDGSPFDTFTYTLTPGSSTATVKMTVICDIAPTAVDDSATVAEDAAPTAVPVLANDTDPDGHAKSVASVTQPANGTVVITGGGTGLTYKPNANYCNSPPGTTPDTFTYTLTPGSSTATVSMTVTCGDDDPVAVDDTATAAEDSAGNAVNVLANDTDVDGGAKSVQSVTQPANGSVVITGGGTGVSYTPSANYCNSPPGTSPDTFTYTLNGGSTATVSMTVTCAPDAPVVTAGGTLSYTENGAPTPIAAALTVTDPDASSITGATVQISANFAGAQDVLALGGVHPGITAIQIGDTLTLSGTASAAAYESALRDVTYANSSDSPSTLLRTVTFTVTDDTSLSDSAARNIQVTAVDDNPVAVNDSTTVGEDSGATLIFVLTNDTDVDGGPIAVSSATQPANGTVSNNGTDVTYTPNANYCNNPPGSSPDTFTYTLTPGGSTATVSVQVTCVADPPNVTTSGGSLAYTESDPATPIDAGLTVTDPDSGAMITGATVAITSNFAGAQDVLALTGLHAPITAGPQVGNTLTLTGTATPAAYQAALRDVTYVNTSEGPSTLARTVTFTVTDDTALSDSATRGITVAAVNDPPTAVDDSGTTDEDTPLSVAAPGVLANDTDVDPGDTKTVVELNGTGTLTQALPSGASVTINANGSYTYNPLAAFQGLSTGQTASDSFTYTMQDGAGAQDTATVNITVNGISDAPSAVADSFDAISNTGLFVGTTRPGAQAGKEITGSVLDNDTDPDTPHASLVVEPVTNAPTTLGGTITIEADGNFTYQPDDADVGVTDTFTYRVCDNSPCNSGTVANSTGTLSLPLTGQVWYVRNNEPAGGDGTSDAPFDTLAEAEAASGTGDTTYVFDGSNTTTNLDTGYAMNANERLIGESRPLSLDPDGGGPLATAPLFPGTSGAQPTLTASNEDVVVLASNVLVDGVDVDPSGTGGGISGGAGTDAVTVRNVNVTDTGTAGTQPGIEMDGTTGVNTFTGVTVTNGGSATAIGVRINNADRVLFANTATNTIATTGAKALDVASTSLLTSRWNDITVTGSGTGAIRLSSATGQPVLGDGSGTDLSLQTTSGATAALDIASSNTVTVDSAGTDTISATGGPALDIRNSNGSQYFFDSASSTNSAGDGVNLDTNLTAPVVINAGTIAGAAGIAFDVNGGGVGGGGVVYDGAINDGPGESVEVTGRDGGGVTFSGNIADSADAGGGIVVSGNSAGSTTFSGASKVLNTGAGNAVIFNNSDGHTLTLSGGGLNIDTTTGKGLEADTSGTITVSGSSNTIDVGANRALNINNTDIDTAATFEHISSNGSATNGISLTNTGTAAGNAGLTVTGSSAGTCGGQVAASSGGTPGTVTGAASGDCTGGTIQASTGAGVVLSSTKSPSLTRLWVKTSGDDGLRLTSVPSLALSDSLIETNGNATGENGLEISQATGTYTITDTKVTGSAESNAFLDQTSGTLTAFTVTSSQFTSTTAAAPGADGLRLTPGGTSNVTASITNSFFSNNRDDQFQVAPTGSATTNVTFSNNTLSDTTATTLGGGITINPATNTDTTAVVNGNDIVHPVLSALNFNLNTDSTAGSELHATAIGNFIGNAGDNGSGAETADGIQVTGNGAGHIFALIKDNDVRQYTNPYGIHVFSRDGDGLVDATIQGNTVTEFNPAGFVLDGIRVEAGSVSGDGPTVCADVGGAAALKNHVTTGGNEVGGGSDIRLRVRIDAAIKLPGYGGAFNDGAAVQAYLAGRNDTTTVSATYTAPAVGYSGGTCTLP